MANSNLTRLLKAVRGFESYHLISVRTNALTWRQSFLLRFVKKEKGEMLMMRAMLLCLAVAFVGLFVYFGIHYAKDVGREIKNTLKKLFG